MRKAQLAGVFALSLLSALSARAETKPATPAVKVAEPSSPARAAFLALSEADRKAAQDALGWLGFYNGVIDGGFGKRTSDALAAYQTSLGGVADGVMTAPTLAGLKDAAAKAKAAVGFRLIDETVTGVRIGAPTKLLDKRETGEGTAALVSKDGTVGLYLRETAGDLAELYKTLSSDTAKRKITYKVIKPDAFFVIAGEDGDTKFYRRYAAPPSGGKLRGFAFLYPKARAKALDPIALAVANSFDPFPAAPMPPVATPAPAPTPEPPKLTATAFAVAPGVAVTALDSGRCKSPMIAGKPVRFLEPDGPLARLGGDFATNGAAPPVGAGEGDLIALSLAPSGARATLAVTAAIPVAGGKVLAALAPEASGAPLFDRQGRLAGFVAPVGATVRRGGVVLAAPHAILSAATLGAPTAGGASLSAAEIAGLRRQAILGVFCAS